MNLENFRECIIEPLKAYSSTINKFRVEDAYKDLQNIYGIVQELQVETSKYDIFELAKINDETSIFQTISLQSRLSTFLKALFIFGDLFVSMLLSEVVGEPGLTLNNFLHHPRPPLLKLSTTQILPAYCTVIYRNKVIAHHDVRRISSLKTSKYIERIVLVPFHEKFHFSKEDIVALHRLKTDYESIISNLAGEENVFVLLKTLFYGIPIGPLGQITVDRKQINVIAERGGCESLNSEKVIEALDQFALAVVNAL